MSDQNPDTQSPETQNPDTQNPDTQSPDAELKIRYQETPNPYALKFILNRAFKSEGKATFKPDSNFQNLPLIASLFELEGTEQVYVNDHTLTFTHSGIMENSEIKKRVESIIQTRWSVHNPSFEMEEEKYKPADRTHLSEELREIEDILDRTIRPGLQADGGDLEVIKYEDNEVHIMYQGACGGCPSAMMGTLEAIENILSYELDNPELRVYPI